MTEITIVTGNAGKLRELEALAKGKLSFRMQKVDLDEIQTLDLRKLTEDKARRAYEIVGSPVIVEDSGAELASLGGLPGPFAKFFEEALGTGALYLLSKVENDPVKIRCTAAYFDGSEIIFGEGQVSGVIVPPRGDNGFGFDPVVQPDGSRKTMAEMTQEEKNAISHRGQAFRDLMAKLNSA